MAEVKKALAADLCVIGAGSAGLSVAAGAAQLGLKTVLIERGAMGGDCLNTGCVPSKALLAAGAAAVAWRQARAFGLEATPPRVDFPAVMRHVKGVIDGIAPFDSQERFEGLGITVLRESAAFAAAKRVDTPNHTVTARRFVIATGSRPLVPPIPGLDELPYLTNETVFDLTDRPDHLIVLGGGPIGCELAQAFVRLGSRVTLVERADILPRADREQADLLADKLREEGIDLKIGWEAVTATGENGQIRLYLAKEGQEEQLESSHLLVAAGRKADYEGLAPEQAGIILDSGRLLLDSRLRTTNRRVYAAGDAAGGEQFTHLAGAHAGVLIKNIAFRIPARTRGLVVPRITYTDPELAEVGMNETQARLAGHAVNLLRWSFHDNDRARAEHTTTGFIKAVVTPKGKILGTSILGPHAGELLQPWILALERGLPISALATTMAPYPTLGEISKRAAGTFYTPKLFSKRTRILVALLKHLG
ncbi:MAG: FAD-dependent oxidoreductase [Rhodospirillales bacterium]|nr:FAD-dependent oxidoreductase [Rhodospirillales bacterium]